MTAKLAVHVFVADGIHDPLALKPVETCATCGLPKANQHHELPPTPVEAKETEARLLGEADS